MLTFRSLFIQTHVSILGSFVRVRCSSSESYAFSLLTAPQVFNRVIAPVSSILHQLDIQILRYLDDWLILAQSLPQALRAKNLILDLCHKLGILVSPRRLHIQPSQSVVYLGMWLDSATLKTFPALERVQKLRCQLGEFLS